MKEKRILAMFITAAVTLVASLAVTFGVYLSLADPVQATNIVTYAYNFNAENDNSLITADEDGVLSFVSSVPFKPTKSVDWKDGQIVWFQNEDLTNKMLSTKSQVWYNDESLASRVKVIPIKITNNFDHKAEFHLDIKLDTASTALKENTYAKIWNFTENNANPDAENPFRFETYSFVDGFVFTLNPNEVLEIALVIYADESESTSLTDIDWQNDFETVNVAIYKSAAL